MKERSILFSAPMVRALLAGTKTQTRRIANDLIGFTSSGQPLTVHGGFPCEYVCPHGRPGDRLWVREAFRFPESLDHLSPVAVGEKALSAGYQTAWCPTQFEADGTRRSAQEWNDFVTPPMTNEPGRLRASMHMPRWASRITLEITGIRVERLQDISDDDLEQEGLQEVIDAGIDHDGYPRDAYRALWESINGAGSWNANPWVWVVVFKRLEGGAA